MLWYCKYDRHLIAGIKNLTDCKPYYSTDTTRERDVTWVAVNVSPFNQAPQVYGRETEFERGLLTKMFYKAQNGRRFFICFNAGKNYRFIIIVFGKCLTMT